MCLGVPGQITARYHEDGLPMARVAFGGVFKRVCLAHTPEAEIGDYVLVHVGFALARLDPAEAARVFDLLAELEQLDEREESP